MANEQCNFATIFSVPNITNCCDDPLCVDPQNISKHGCAWKFPTWCLLSEYCNKSAAVGGARVTTFRLKSRPPPPPAPPDGTSPIEQNMAAFFVSMSNYSFFSTSGQWIDSSWQWHWEYDAWAHCGKPLGPAVEAPPGSFTRRFENCTASFVLGSGGRLANTTRVVSV